MTKDWDEDESKPRWSIWIDIEGFSAQWSQERRSMRGLGFLMSGILTLGETVFPADGDRLFAHQFGDGFIIVSDFHEPDLERCAAVAVSLMRHVALHGFMARAAIAEGDYADVSGLWPRAIEDARRRCASTSTIALGSGLMTLLPTMGTALIEAKKLDEKCRTRGAVLAISSERATRVPVGFPRRQADDQPDVTTIDWVHATSPVIDRIASAGIGASDVEAVAVAARSYLGSQTLNQAWKDGTGRSNDL